jgi:hypothetical protein
MHAMKAKQSKAMVLCAAMGPWQLRAQRRRAGFGGASSFGCVHYYGLEGTLSFLVLFINVNMVQRLLQVCDAFP